MRFSRVLAVLALTALLGSSMAMAIGFNKDKVVIIKWPDLQLGDLYIRSELIPLPDFSVNQPNTQSNGPVGRTGGTLAPQPGPIAFSGPTDIGAVLGARLSSSSGLSPSMLGGLTGSGGGGSIYSVKQRADREIKQLIRKLN